MKGARGLISNLVIGVVLACLVDAAAARLPVPPETPESKAKAEEAAAKAAAAAKREAEELARYQDKAVTHYRQSQSK